MGAGVRRGGIGTPAGRDKCARHGRKSKRSRGYLSNFKSILGGKAWALFPSLQKDLEWVSWQGKKARTAFVWEMSDNMSHGRQLGYEVWWGTKKVWTCHRAKQLPVFIAWTRITDLRSVTWKQHVFAKQLFSVIIFNNNRCVVWQNM